MTVVYPQYHHIFEAVRRAGYGLLTSIYQCHSIASNEILVPCNQYSNKSSQPVLLSLSTSSKGQTQHPGFFLINLPVVAARRLGVRQLLFKPPSWGKCNHAKSFSQQHELSRLLQSKLLVRREHAQYREQLPLQL